MEHKDNGPHKGSPIQRMMSNHLPPPPQDDDTTNNQEDQQKIDNDQDNIITSIVPLGQNISTLLDNENDDNSVYSSVFSSDSDDSGDISDGISELGSSFGNMSHNTDHSNTNDRQPSSDLEGSTMGIPNIHNEDNNLVPSIPTYPEGQYEDDKAQLIAKLLQNHGGNFVATSLVERSSLIQSVMWLSHHVPNCVLKSLFECIMKGRKRRFKIEERRKRILEKKLKRRSSLCSSGAATLLEGGDRLKRQSKSPVSSSVDRTTSATTTTTISNNNQVGTGYDFKTFTQPYAPSHNTNRWLNPDGSISTGTPSAAGTNTSPTITNTNNTSSSPFIKSHKLPYTKNHQSAILFCDISGFTKIATTLDVESLSNAINSYFEMIVKEIIRYGGDVLKFAGDALFAEWKVSSSSCHNSVEEERNEEILLEQCVNSAANCAAAIVANCSDYLVMSKSIGFSKSSSRRTSLMKKGSSLRGDLSSDTSMIGKNRIRSASMTISPSSDTNKRRSTLSMDTLDSVSSIDSPDQHQQQQQYEAEIRRRRSTMTSSEVATLNVKCAVGVGHIVGIHVGNDISRREYLILGDPIRQVARAESMARHGQVYASPEAVKYLTKKKEYILVVGEEGERRRLSAEDDPLLAAALIAWDHAVDNGAPVRIVERNQKFFESKCTSQSQQQRQSSSSSRLSDGDTLLQSCDELNNAELEWLKRMISLYVHPVVVNEENEHVMPERRRSDQERHLAEAEIRNVYTCFITPLIDYKLTGNEEKDKLLFSLLNDIMNLCTRELDNVQGHLRQFILDDKGLVLICTFGLRGSTFPNMIAQRAVPFSLSIHKALEEELGIKSTIGATFGKAYCGVVGGIERHEFAVLGPSVNLAARLMASEGNPGILVDKNVRLLSSQVFFKPLPAVKAKGYDEPVPIFEPKKHVADNEWGQAKRNFIGRENEIKSILCTAKDVMFHGPVSKLFFMSALSGSGKSTLMVQTTALVRAMAKKLQKRVIITRNISNEGDTRIPFSLFRSIFRDVLSQVQLEDEENASIRSGTVLPRIGSGTSLKRSTLDGSDRSGSERGRRSSKSTLSDCDLRRRSSGDVIGDNSKERHSSADSVDFSVDKQWDELSLQSQSSKSSTMSTDATRFRFICQELNAPPEFVEVVGKRLLGLRERNTNTSAGNAKAPNVQKIVDFMADAFVRCTKHANLVLLALDDVQWMDEMSWMVVQAIFERGQNVLIFCGSRPLSSNPLSMNPQFWSDLHGQFQNEGRYMELNLAPFTEPEVKEMIATTLEFELNDIDESFSWNVFATSGGMPYYLRYVLDAIKQNKLTVKLDNGLIGMKSSDDKIGSSFGSVNELLLCRIDALDSSVRSVLHLAAVIGMEFTLLDAALAYEEMVGVEDNPGRFEASNSLLRSAIDLAIEEGIIEQIFLLPEDDGDDNEDWIDDDTDNICSSMGNIRLISLKGRRKAHPFFAENRRLRFTHDSWKTSILSVMLNEKKQEMHEHVAISLERELDDEAHNQGDFQKQIRVFKHWKSSGNFAKAALLAINIGGELMLLGLNSQAILLFDDVLDILKEMADDQLRVACTSNTLSEMPDDDEIGHYGGISSIVLDAIDAPELEKLIKVNVARGKCYSTLGRGKEGAEAYQSALDILNYTPSANDEEFDRSVSFPIFSGLFVVLKMGAIEQDEECSYEKDLCKKFSEQARLKGDPVHYGRAMAMEAETLGRLGNFEEALEVDERIKSIYNIETQHAAICKAYGSDRVGQAFAHSVNYNIALGRTQAALDACKYIVEELAPKSDPKNIHNMFCLLYSVIIAFKENGLASKALDLFQSRIEEPFQEHFGPGGSTWSAPMFKPIRTLLTLEVGRSTVTAPMFKPIRTLLTLEVDEDNVNVKDENIADFTLWALDSENFEEKISRLEVALASFCASPLAIHSEICFDLAKRQLGDEEKRNQLIQKAISLMQKSIENTAKIPFANNYARRKLKIMEVYAKEELGIY